MATGQPRWVWLGLAMTALAVCLLAGSRMAERRHCRAVLPPPPSKDGVSLARRLAQRRPLGRRRRRRR